MDRIEVMRLFMRVAESGNFSRVARATGISQPTVSKVVAALEAKLGAQLLWRTTRGLTLTDAGHDFYASAVSIVERVDELENRLSNNAGEPSGLVRVALSPAFGRMEIVPRLPAFFARHPDVSIDFTVAQRYVNLVTEGIDVAIRVGPLNDSSMIARRLAEMTYLTVASPDYLTRAGTPDTIADLRAHQCVAFMSHDAPRPWEFRDGGDSIKFLPQGRVRSNDAEYLRAAVLAGLGIGHNAGWLYRDDVAAGRLKPVLQAFSPPAMPIHAVWPGGRQLAAKTRAFIDFVAELFADNHLL
jgi:LysR family transcriptional regulator for bpeEF and oprC